MSIAPITIYIQFYQDATGQTYRGEAHPNRHGASWERYHVTQGFPDDRPAFLVRVKLKDGSD